MAACLVLSARSSGVLVIDTSTVLAVIVSSIGGLVRQPYGGGARRHIGADAQPGRGETRRWRLTRTSVRCGRGAWPPRPSAPSDPAVPASRRRSAGGVRPF